MPPLRVVIAAGIFPPAIGGPATYAPEMAAGLVARGHEVTVVTLTDGAGHDDRQYPFRVVRVPRGASTLTRLRRAVIEIARCGRRADVLLTNGLSPQATIASKLVRRPVVEKIVGDLAWEKAIRQGWCSAGFEAFQSERLGCRVEALKAARRWWIRQADFVITPSRYLAAIVRGWGVPEVRIAVVANAVQLPEGTRTFTPPSSPSTVATVGRLVVWKHVDGIIRAIRDVSDTTLLVIGDGPERQKLERLVSELGMDNRVRFTGQVGRSELSRLTRQCDLFVLNSSYEGLPHVVLEAMAAGLPIVATAVGGTVEVIRHTENGMLIRAGERELRDTIARVLNDPGLWCRLSENGRQTAAEFTTALMVQKTEQILVSVARTEPPSPHLSAPPRDTTERMARRSTAAGTS